MGNTEEQARSMMLSLIIERVDVQERVMILELKIKELELTKKLNKLIK